jgi:hypothetical protein
MVRRDDTEALILAGSDVVELSDLPSNAGRSSRIASLRANRRG